MKKTYLSLAFLTLAVCLGASAQELTREVPYEKHESSVVVEQNDGRWVVAKNHNGEASLVLVDSTGSTAKVIRLGHGVEVKDLIDSRHFCGSILEGSVRKGLLGYFNMSAFNTGKVSYMVIEGVESLEKMVRYDYMDCLHVSMIGRHGDGTSRVVDAVLPPPDFGFSPNTWKVWIGTINYFPCHLDDITATDSKVVLSGRNVFTRSGFLFAFDIEGLLSAPFFFNKPGKTRMPDQSVARPIWLTGGLLDTFFAAYTTYYHFQVSKYGGDDVTRFSKKKFSLIGAFDINNVLVDVCTNQAGTGVHLLCTYRNSDYDPYGSYIWHIPASKLNPAFGSVGDILCNEYYDTQLFSITRRRHQKNGIVASGERLNSPVLSLHRLKSGVWGNCTHYLDYPLDFDYFNNEVEPPKATITGECTDKVFQTRVCTVESHAVNNVCQ